MATNRLNQKELRQEGRRLDSLYALIPTKPVNSKINRTWVVDTLKQGKVMKAEIDSSFHPTQRRIIITINDIWCLTVRFNIVDGQWVAVSPLSWSRTQSFSDARQFAEQYFNYKSTGKKQFGIHQKPQQLSLFEVLA